MRRNNKIGIIVDDDFATKNMPPYPYPTFFSYETPLRIKAILKYLKEKAIFENERIVKIEPMTVQEEIIHLAHTTYHIDSIKNLSNRGNGLLNDEVFITEDTFELAKKAVGGAIKAMESVINNNISQAFALIRPPGHHALREIASGLCVFNNVANSIIYLREKLQYNNKIAIIDIDAHFGDGIAQYFYEDPSVLYFSVHEYDFIEGDIGFINELGAGEGIGRNINFPIPMNTSDQEFLEFVEIIEPLLREYQPDLIIVAAGFDMYFDDPLGNCLLTSISYYRFTEIILKIAEELCEGKLVYILEGGYSLIGLPYCVYAILKALFKEKYDPPEFERNLVFQESKKQDILKIKKALLNLLSNFWRI
ncbi:MAG: histone deacetylase [Promethearchaeota archaeon]